MIKLINFPIHLLGNNNNFEYSRSLCTCIYNNTPSSNLIIYCYCVPYPTTIQNGMKMNVFYTLFPARASKALIHLRHYTHRTAFE